MESRFSRLPPARPLLPAPRLSAATCCAALWVASLGCSDGKTTSPPAAAAPNTHDEHSAHGGANVPAQATPSAAASVFFVFPQEGARLFPKSTVVFGVSGLTVTPAGEHIDDASRGHHHLIIDGAPVPVGQIVPADEQHIHFGKGQTETSVALTPGKHTLTLQFADGAHRSYGPALSQTIHVEVVAEPTVPRIFFANLKDGDKVKSPVQVQFGLDGFTLRPAGEDPLDKTSGHHHLIIDGEPVAAGRAVPADEKHIHFGKAQTETQVELAPGPHTLHLQLADGAHASYGPELSARVNIVVE